MCWCSVKLHGERYLGSASMRVASHSDHMHGPDMLGRPAYRFCTLKTGSALRKIEKIEAALL